MYRVRSLPGIVPMECHRSEDYQWWTKSNAKGVVSAYYFCPEKAVQTFPINTCGEWFVSNTRFGPMVHARLGIAEENSGKLVALMSVKKGGNWPKEGGMDLSAHRRPSRRRVARSLHPWAALRQF